MQLQKPAWILPAPAALKSRMVDLDQQRMCLLADTANHLVFGEVGKKLKPMFSSSYKFKEDKANSFSYRTRSLCLSANLQTFWNSAL